MALDHPIRVSIFLNGGAGAEFDITPDVQQDILSNMLTGGTVVMKRPGVNIPEDSTEMIVINLAQASIISFDKIEEKSSLIVPKSLNASLH